MITLIGLMLSFSVALLYNGIQRIRTPGYAAQLAAFSSKRETTKPLTSYERWVRPYALRLADKVDLLRGFTDYPSVARQLDYAGNPLGMTPHEFYGVQLFSTLVTLFIGVLWFVGIGSIALILPIVGFIFPHLWLRGKAKERQEAIKNTLPQFVELFSTCVSAGLGFDVALSLIAERSKGPLYEELRRLLHELSIGEVREQAFHKLMKRNSTKELHRFVDALLESGKMGTPVTVTLLRQAENMRVVRQNQIREQGKRKAIWLSTLTPLMTFPLLILIMGGVWMALKPYEKYGATLF
jgi:tight adherence protein C